MRGLALIAGLAACRGAPPLPVPAQTPPPRAEPAPPPGIAAAALACPIGVPGTSVTVEDTDDGAAMIFLTSGDVGALRTQLFAMADLHNRIFAALPVPRDDLDEARRAGDDDDDDPIHASGPGPRPRTRVATGQEEERDLVVLVPSSARVEAIEGGARLAFSTEVSERDALRAEVRGEADAIEDACAWPE